MNYFTLQGHNPKPATESQWKAWHDAWTKDRIVAADVVEPGLLLTYFSGMGPPEAPDTPFITEFHHSTRGVLIARHQSWSEAYHLHTTIKTHCQPDSNMHLKLMEKLQKHGHEFADTEVIANETMSEV